MGLCLGLATSLSRHSSRRSHTLQDRRGDGHHSPNAGYHNQEDLFDSQMVPYPVYPTHARNAGIR